MRARKKVTALIAVITTSLFLFSIRSGDQVYIEEEEDSLNNVPPQDAMSNIYKTWEKCMTEKRASGENVHKEASEKMENMAKECEQPYLKILKARGFLNNNDVSKLQSQGENDETSFEMSETSAMVEIQKKLLNSDPIVDILTMTLIQSRRMKPAILKKSWPLKLQNGSLEPCPILPLGLQGPYKVNTTILPWVKMEKQFSGIQKGGHHQPATCLAQHRVAIIVPYRNRADHLKVLINHLHSFLRRQQLDYAIIVVEQIANQTFNRAKLMNVGYMEAKHIYPWECFVFHDVDLLPEDDRILYGCPVMPRQMSTAMSTFNYKLPYPEYFGGVTALTLEHMKTLNGFSNDYWGWGGEDDDLFKRVHLAGYNISSYPSSIARYKMQKHKHASEDGNGVNDCRWTVLNTTETRWQFSGLRTLNYKVEKRTFHSLFLHVLVDLFEEDSREDLANVVKC